MAEKFLKIAMFGHKRVPSREGGIEVVVDELSTRLAAKGHSVVCYNRKGQHVSGAALDRRTEYKGVRIKEVPTLNRRGLAALSAAFFAALAASFSRADVVHIHAEGPAFFAFLPKLFGKRVIVTIHGLDWARAKWGRVASWFIRAGEKNAVRYADEIIVLSAAVKEYFRTKYGRETHFIPNGVNRPERAEADEIGKWGLTKDSYILFLGRLVPEKGVHTLVEAAKGLSKQLVIVGGSSDSQDYVDRLKQAGEGAIFTGFQQGRALAELFSNAYVFCLPSELEGMPLSLLEAMSYGNCCLVSDIPECAEVVEDKALTFEKGNVRELREKLAWLIGHPDEVARYKRGAADFICKKCSWDDVVEKTLALYR